MSTSLKLKSLKFKVTNYDSSEDEDDQDRSSDLQGVSLEKLNLGPRKKLLVLCLGGLLVERKRSPYGVQYGSRRPDFVCGNFLVYKRPFLDEFLKFCFQRFEVGIWASAMEHNVSPVMSYLTSGLSRRFAFVWSQKECTDSGYGSLEKKTKPIFLKELKKIWGNEGLILPWPKGTYSSANTLLIDTEPSKALLNPVR